MRCRFISMAGEEKVGRKEVLGKIIACVMMCTRGFVVSSHDGTCPFVTM